MVVWSSDADYSVRGQRYTAGGVPVGRVRGHHPRISPRPGQVALRHGPQQRRRPSPGMATAVCSSDYIDVWGQQRSTAFNKVDGPIGVGQVTSSVRCMRSGRPLAGDNFAAVWASRRTPMVPAATACSSNSRAPGSIVRQADPGSSILSLRSPLPRTTSTATPRADRYPGLRVVDADSANFAGGRLVVGALTSANGNAAYSAERATQDAFTILP